jgi:cytochrome c biogenesis protein CcmG/thiol:disulfide interchange protein DsbE
VKVIPLRRLSWDLLTISALVLLLGACSSGSIQRAPSHIDIIGRTAPAIQNRTVEGEKFNLREYEGKKIVIVNFFGTWCPPCRAELPELYSVYRENQKNVQLVGVALNIEDEAVRRFMRNLNVDFPAILSPRNTDSGIPERYQVPTVPTTAVIGLDGRIIYYRPGMLRDHHFDELRTVITDELTPGSRASPP